MKVAKKAACSASGWSIFGMVIGAVAVLFLATNAHDLYRYIKISSM